MVDWEQSLFDLILRASTDLPADVERALHCAGQAEEPGSNAAEALQVILDNIQLARKSRRPLCQDTGTLLFWVEAPPTFRQTVFRSAAESAIVRATEQGLLRHNCVDTISGKNTGNNLGEGSPVIHWREANRETVDVSLILKGGGCENVGCQYSLPDKELDAGRDMEGVRRCLLHAVHQAQGRGCAPGVLGVTIGGDRATGYAASKRQFLRHIGQRNETPELAKIEERVLAEANTLGIGPMGFGGRATLLDVFVGVLDRIPASYFVSVSYMCWAFRRQRMEVSIAGKILSRL